MSYRFEIWDVETGNAIDEFPDEGAALAFVRSAVEEFGDDYARTLALIVDNPVHKVQTLAAGADLVKRARAAAVAA